LDQRAVTLDTRDTAFPSDFAATAKGDYRVQIGHGFGGWFALWAVVRYPRIFGGSGSTSPDPSDFRDFQGIDLYAPGANMDRDAHGAPRPLDRDHDTVLTMMETVARVETVLGHTGGQLQSFDWVFSPRRADGTPAPMFDRESGAVDPAVMAYWRATLGI
jgi:hypothetical protein